MTFPASAVSLISQGINTWERLLLLSAFDLRLQRNLASSPTPVGLQNTLINFLSTDQIEIAINLSYNTNSFFSHQGDIITTVANIFPGGGGITIPTIGAISPADYPIQQWPLAVDTYAKLLVYTAINMEVWGRKNNMSSLCVITTPAGSETSLLNNQLTVTAKIPFDYLLYRCGNNAFEAITAQTVNSDPSL